MVQKHKVPEHPRIGVQRIIDIPHSRISSDAGHVLLPAGPLRGISNDRDGLSLLKIGCSRFHFIRIVVQAQNDIGIEIEQAFELAEIGSMLERLPPIIRELHSSIEKAGHGRHLRTLIEWPRAVDEELGRIIAAVIAHDIELERTADPLTGKIRRPLVVVKILLDIVFERNEILAVHIGEGAQVQVHLGIEFLCDEWLGGEKKESDAENNALHTVRDLALT